MGTAKTAAARERAEKDERIFREINRVLEDLREGKLTYVDYAGGTVDNYPGAIGAIENILDAGGRLAGVAI